MFLLLGLHLQIIHLNDLIELVLNHRDSSNASDMVADRRVGYLDYIVSCHASYLHQGCLNTWLGGIEGSKRKLTVHTRIEYYQ